MAVGAMGGNMYQHASQLVDPIPSVGMGSTITYMCTLLKNRSTRIPQGVANRDIKLENTLLSKNPAPNLLPIVKLCDFGFSKVEGKHDHHYCC